MANVPTGTTYFIVKSTDFGSAITTTAVSNATEAVVTANAHGLVANDIVEVTSGWGRLNKRVARVKSPDTNTFVLEGIDTTNTDFYPAGTGIGSVRKVSAFTQITTVMNPNNSGGEAKSVSYKYLESDVEYSINDGFSAISDTFDIDADATSSVGYQALKALSDVQTDTILKKVLRSGSAIYIPGKVSLNENPKMQEGQINRCSVAFNATNRITRY